MEIQQGMGGRARSQRPRPSSQQPRGAAQEAAQLGTAARPAAPLAPPVAVISQPLPTPLTDRVTPRARPSGLDAAAGYWRARKLIEK